MEPVTIVLAAVVVLLAVLLVSLMMLARRERARGIAAFDDKALRAVVDQALAAHATASGTVTAGPRHATAAPDRADEMHAAALSEAEQVRAAAHIEADRIRSSARVSLADERARMQEEHVRLLADATRTLEAERASVRAERERLTAEMHALADDQRTLAADLERLRAERSDLARRRDEVLEREATLDARRIEVDAEQQRLAAAAETLTADQARRSDEHQAELARIADLTVADARAELLAAQEEAVRRDAALLVRRIESEAEATAQQRARAIVADAICRVASDQTSQSVVSVLQLPSDDLKGRIIGREGRNIRAFETITGVNVIIDDTPEAVLLSCFDPVRREIGRVTLQTLIDDGRIHPHRIEEAYEKAHEEVDALCARAAEDALLQVGISDLHPELATLVGRLKYRTSYGQNVLGHLVETSYIARMMAAELGIDPTVAARGAFLHDIGKALTHEAQGSHAMVGAELARKYGESDEVAHCIEAHHDEVAPTTVAAVLTQAADACSGGRPGARRESLESYVQRLEHIEAIAAAKDGVDKVFAMQAGRELRVMVRPDAVDDLEAQLMAREVAKQIEEELTYPGQVRVTVIRETRATEVAR